MVPPDTLDGGCACGAVHYRLVAAPLFVHCCHCRDCQRQTGSGFAVNALIEADRIALLAGTPRPVRVPTDSGHPHDIYRCPDCGTALWSDYTGVRGIRFVRTGTLDTPDRLAPDIHIHTRSKLPRVALPPGVPAVPVYYDWRQVWPAASQERRRAIAGRRETG
ncbi:MAG: GFA family protein [Stellaceae bacterium]